MTTFNPGDRVTLDADAPGRINLNGVVLAADDERTRTRPDYVNIAECIPVLEDLTGRVGWWNRGRVSHEAVELAVDTPVRYTGKNTELTGLVGKTKALPEGRYVRTVFPDKPSGRTDGTWMLKVSNLTPIVEPTYVLTHEELTMIEAGLRTGIPSDENDAADIVRKHLHPTVTRTFTVTVEQTGDMPPLTSESLRDAVISNSFVNNQIGVTIVDTTKKENDR